MQCNVCGVETNKTYCTDCEEIMEQIIRQVGEKRWAAIDDCSHIYPLVKRAVKGELNINDIINALEVED
ncbi:hypothetical protein HNV12_04460 [Methanococcoides sp. SA1]|nr:hypothetical protein [Methanococcoides sp. SA1]